MDGKIVSAFVAGAVIASGIVYMSVRPPSVVKPGAAKTAVAGVGSRAGVESPSAPVAASVVPPSVESAAREGLRPAPAPQALPLREKPSPMPPAVRRERTEVVAKAPRGIRAAEPVAIAHVETPPVPVPVPQPSAPEAKAPEIRPVNPPPPASVATPPPAPEQPAPPPPEPPPPSAPPVLSAPAPLESDVRVPHTVTLEAGTMLPVRIGETISSARNQIGDPFLATLDHALILDGFIIAERGTKVEGRVVELEPAGRTRGVSRLGIALVRLFTSDGQRVHIHTEPYRKDGQSSAGTDAAKIGAGAAIGAAIGAMAGGGKGAAIGAGVGGAAGVGDVLLTRGKAAEIPVETRVTFRVEEPVTITEKLD